MAGIDWKAPRRMSRLIGIFSAVLTRIKPAFGIIQTQIVDHAVHRLQQCRHRNDERQAEQHVQQLIARKAEPRKRVACHSKTSTVSTVAQQVTITLLPKNLKIGAISSADL